MPRGTCLALLFVLFGIQLWFVDSAALLYSTTGPLVGASYADVHVLLGGTRLSALAAVAAALVLYGVARDKLPWFAFLAVAGYAAVGLVFRGLAPAAEQKFVIAPNELARERPYLQLHIAATRRAWRLDSVATRDLEGDVQLTMADIRANAPTIDNVRLWERDLLKQTLRAAPGDPHLLRLRVGERRSLHDRRPVPPGPPLGARAQHRRRCRRARSSTSG